MIRHILGWFGYAKVPVEAVRLSMMLEDGWRKFIGAYAGSESEENAKKAFGFYLEKQKYLTEWLRSCRRL